MATTADNFTADNFTAEPEKIALENAKPNAVRLETVYDDDVNSLKAVQEARPEVLREFSDDELARMEKKLRMKIDIRILPMIVLMFILNYIDRNNIASARLGGLEADLGLKGSEYQTCVSILFVGYVLMQVPSNLCLNRIGKPSIFLPTAMIIWGVLSACAGATHNFGGLLAVRFLVGFIEAAYFPGCLFLLSSWYTRKELGLRMAILYMGSLLAGAFSGLIAAGILNNMDGAAGIAGWRWLFIIEGALTAFFAFCAMFILPDFPSTTKWLSEHEKALAIWRLDKDNGDAEQVNTEEGGMLHGFILALKDIKMWLLVLILFCVSYSASIYNFFPTVVDSLGYGQVETLCLTAPPYILTCITSGLNSWHSDRVGERYLHIVIPPIFSIIAYILIASTTSIGPRYFAMMIVLPGAYSNYSLILTWVSNCMPKPAAKRAAALAFINCIANIANIIASYMFYDGAAPRYVVACSVNGACALIAILGATVLRIHLMRENKKLARGVGTELMGPTFRYQT